MTNKIHAQRARMQVKLPISSSGYACPEIEVANARKSMVETRHARPESLPTRVKAIPKVTAFLYLDWTGGIFRLKFS